MQTLDNIGQIEQRCAALSTSIEQEDFAAASEQMAQLLTSLEHVFNEPSSLDAELVQRLQLVSEQINTQVALLSEQHLQIKDSLDQIAAVKSANKIKKTYQID